jgi:hypothetical protein
LLGVIFHADLAGYFGSQFRKKLFRIQGSPSHFM